MRELEELTGTDKDLADLVLKRPAPGKHAARSAIAHIERAFRLKDIDPEMALFRAITAEEEAARAIFDALQRRKYPGAERINWRDHKHKAAVMPFFSAVARLLAQVGFADAQVEIFQAGEEKTLRLHIAFKRPDGQVVSWYPNPPLQIFLLIDGKPCDFSDEIQGVASEENFATMRKFVDSFANERNRLLYATTEGVPRILGSVDEHLRQSRANVFSMITIYLLIDSHAQLQSFVVQALSSFLGMINRLPKE